MVQMWMPTMHKIKVRQVVWKRSLRALKSIYLSKDPLSVTLLDHIPNVEIYRSTKVLRRRDKDHKAKIEMGGALA